MAARPGASSGSAASKLAFILLPPWLLLLPALLPFPALERLRSGWQGVEITDRSGEHLFSLPGPEGSFMIRRAAREIPAAVKEIFVSLEDRRFYQHPGVDPLAAARALRANLAAGRIVSGASTITMQLARLARPHARNFTGKLGEALDALRIEARLDKDEILTLYLNHLPFGRHTLGVEAAARRYFSRPLKELDRAQVLLLAVVSRSPARLDPFNQPQRLRLRALAAGRSLAPALSRPWPRGTGEGEVGAALASLRQGGAVLRAPHFVFHLRDHVLPALEALGREGPARIVTTLDLQLTEALIARLDTLLAARARPGLSNGSVAAIDNASGEILAWAGSRDFFDSAGHGQVDGVRARHPSGSTLKPFLYALALERGYTASSLLPDRNPAFGPAASFGGDGTYRPRNFDRRSRGEVRLRTALASSLNAPAACLLSELGLPAFLDHLQELGLVLPPDAAAKWGLGAVIGNAEASLLELVRAFSVFPNRGRLNGLRFLLAVQTLDGRTPRLAVHGRAGPRPSMASPLSPSSSGPRRIYSEETAWLIADILSDAPARATGFGTRTRFHAASPAMFKSGTASEYAGLWCLGATAGHTVGVWAGDFQGVSAYGTTGSALPAELAAWALDYLAERGSKGPTSPGAEHRRCEVRDLAKPGEQAWMPSSPGAWSPGVSAPGLFPRPEGLVPVRVCAVSGLKAASECPAARTEYFRKSEARGLETCSLHGPAAAFRAGKPALRILSPVDGAVYFLDPGLPESSQEIPVRITETGREPLEARLNGRPLELGPGKGPGLALKPGRYLLSVAGSVGKAQAAFTVR